LWGWSARRATARAIAIRVSYDRLWPMLLKKSLAIIGES
jgi:hypothetical protein